MSIHCSVNLCLNLFIIEFKNIGLVSYVNLFESVHCFSLTGLVCSLFIVLFIWICSLFIVHLNLFIVHWFSLIWVSLTGNTNICTYIFFRFKWDYNFNNGSWLPWGMREFAGERERTVRDERETTGERKRRERFFFYFFLILK